MEIKDFELPKDGNFTEDEVKGLKALGDYIKSQFEAMASGIKSNESVVSDVKSELEKAGFTGEKLRKLEDAMKAQGEALATMKGTARHGKSDFEAQIDAFIKNQDNIAAVKSKQVVSVELNTKDAALMTTANATSAINLWNTEVDRTIHSAPTEPNVIFDRLFKGYASSPNIAWVNRVNEEGGAAFVAEGALKPLKDWEYTTETSTAKKVAVSCKVSTEMLADAPFMRSEIDRLLREDLLRVVNEKVLNGTGTGAEIKGVTVGAAGYTATELNDKVENPNYADAIRAAVLQARLLGFYPDVVFINPADRALIDLTKDTTGHYISQELLSLIRYITIVDTTNIPAGKFLLMDTREWMVRIYENLRLEYGWENDDFRKNLVTVVAEMRLHSYQDSLNAGSVVYDSFATVQAAIEKPAVTPGA